MPLAFHAIIEAFQRKKLEITKPYQAFFRKNNSIAYIPSVGRNMVALL